MFTLRMTCTLTLTVAAVACAVSACGSSSSGGPAFPGDDGSTSGSTSGSSTGASSTSSGSSSSSGAPDGSGSSSGHLDSGLTCDPDGGQVATNVKFDSSGKPICLGNQGCDLKANVCCIDTTTTVAACLPTSQACLTGTSARFGCVQKSDCPGVEVCCLQADQTAKTAGSVCQDVSKTGGKCSPTVTTTHGSAQLCQTDAECKSGCCIWQDCTVMNQPLQFTMCGLQTSSVFTCTVHQP